MEQAINSDTNVAIPELGLTGTVMSVARGWYGVALINGETKKFRGKQLKAIQEAATAPVESSKDDNDNEPVEPSHKMAKTLRIYREGYQKTTSASGKRSADTGDEVATALRGMDHETVMDLCDQLLGTDCRALYHHLNNGQKRMCAGNRIRAAWKAGNEEVCILVSKLNEDE